MSLLRRLLGRTEPVGERGPLFEPVREAMADARAYAWSHGGDIELVGVDGNGVVTIRMKGNCRGCPIADLTVKIGIEQNLKRSVPGVTKVVQVR